jgi:hypothetical protein
MQNFSSPASTQTDLDKFFTIFKEFFLFFFKKIQNSPILNKVSNRASYKAPFTYILEI